MPADLQLDMVSLAKIKRSSLRQRFRKVIEANGHSSIYIRSQYISGEGSKAKIPNIILNKNGVLKSKIHLLTETCLRVQN